MLLNRVGFRCKAQWEYMIPDLLERVLALLKLGGNIASLATGVCVEIVGVQPEHLVDLFQYAKRVLVLARLIEFCVDLLQPHLLPAKLLGAIVSGRNHQTLAGVRHDHPRIFECCAVTRDVLLDPIVGDPLDQE